MNELPNLVSELHARVDQLANITNGSVLAAQQANAQLTPLRAEITRLTELVAALEGYKTEVLRIRQSWWPTLRTELALPKYADWVTAKNAEAIFADLTAKTISVQLESIPAAIVRAAIGSVLGAVVLGNFPAETKAAWERLLKYQADIIANATEVPRESVTPMIDQAKAAGIVPANYTLGMVQISRADQLALGDEIKSPIDVIKAMDW